MLSLPSREAQVPDRRPREDALPRLHIAICFASGAALAFAFPEPDLFVLAWVAIAPLLWVTHAAGARKGALLGLAFGLGFFGTLLIWIKYVGWIAWAMLTLLQIVFIGSFGAGWGVVTRRLTGFPAVVFAGASWVVLEFARQNLPHVGFTWGQLAQSQHDLLWMLRWTRLGGGWALSFLVVGVNALLLVAVRGVREARKESDGLARRGLRRAVVALMCIAVTFAAPVVMRPPAMSGPIARVAIVQGNVPRVFSGTIAEKDEVILASHARLTRRLASAGVDLVVWPESSVGLDLNRLPYVRGTVAQSARAAGAEMVVGGNQDVGTDEYRVLAYHFSPEGEILDVYQKTHLVPFGEYVPWRGVLGGLPMLQQIPRDAVPGASGKLFDTAIGFVAPVISFEGDFGSLVRERIGEGGRLLVVATNTSTWETSWASAQHVAFSQVRAAENGVWVAHAALSGISAFVQPDGSVVRRTDLWTEDTLVQQVQLASARETFYTRAGDWLPFVSAFLVAAGLGIAWVKREVSVEA